MGRNVYCLDDERAGQPKWPALRLTASFGRRSPPLFAGRPICVSESITVRRLPLTLRPNSSRVLLRPFFPTRSAGRTRSRSTRRAHAWFLRGFSPCPKNNVSALLDEVFKEFGDRHQRVSDILAQRFLQVRQYLPADVEVSEARQLLIGSYFTSEYSLESAALFNPSIIPHPDQANVAEGSVRVILSLRATGEGHISSITFRSGLLDENGEIELERCFTLCDPTASGTFRGV